MVGLFADQVRDARTSRSTIALARLWARTLVDVVASVPQEHLRKESTVLQPVESTAISAPAARTQLQRVAVVVASVPVILWAVLWVVAPGFMEPVFSIPPAIYGLPLGLVIIAFAGGMGLFGWFVVRRSASMTVSLGAILILTIPALALIFMTPAVVLFLSNLD